MRLNCNNQKLRCSSQRKAFRKKAVCAVTMAQAVFLPSGDFSKVVDKSRL